MRQKLIQIRKKKRLLMFPALVQKKKEMCICSSCRHAILLMAGQQSCFGLIDVPGHQS